MGNCITSRAIVSEDVRRQRGGEANRQKKTAAAAAEVGRITSTTFRAADYDDEEDRNKEKRSVRFRLCEEEEEEEISRKTKSTGAVRIKLVLTQKELDRILNINGDEDSSSAERLLMKAINNNNNNNMRKRSTTALSRLVSDGEKYGNFWRPSLASIPEETISIIH